MLYIRSDEGGRLLFVLSDFVVSCSSMEGSRDECESGMNGNERNTSMKNILCGSR